MTKIGINQPHYLPWRLYYERIREVDLHVILDHVQFEKNSLVNRNKLSAIGKQPFFITLPIASKGKFGNLAINNLEISESVNWRRKHVNSIRSNLMKTCNSLGTISKIIKAIEVIRDKPDFISLVKDIDSIILKQLNISTPLVYSSDMNITTQKSEMVLEICTKLGASKYLSGPGGSDYLNTDEFKRNNIEIEYTRNLYERHLRTSRSIAEYLSVLVDL